MTRFPPYSDGSVTGHAHTSAMWQRLRTEPTWLVTMFANIATPASAYGVLQAHAVVDDFGDLVCVERLS